MCGAFLRQHVRSFWRAAGEIAENDGPLAPISFYARSKLAAEAYISVYAHTFGIRSLILRFPNVVGERATHGAVYDFIHKLKKDPMRLEVLGDGRQTKPYLYVGDLIAAIEAAWDAPGPVLSVFHAAGEGQTSAKEIAEIVVERFGRAQTRMEYTGGARGWPGDVPRFEYDTRKIRGLGWRPQYNSTQALRHAVDEIFSNGF